MLINKRKHQNTCFLTFRQEWRDLKWVPFPILVHIY